jgi:hypothetical protein
MYFSSYVSALLFTSLFLVFTVVSTILSIKNSATLRRWDEQVHEVLSPVKNRTIQLILAIGILMVLFFLDFTRDYLFKNINMQINYMYYFELGQWDRFNYTDSSMEKLLDGLSANTLYYLKYLLTLILTILYAIICWLFLRFTYPTLNSVPYVRLFYGISFWLLCTFFIFAMYPFGYELKHNLYLISMEIGHFIQSSLPPLLLVLVLKMTNQLKPQKEPQA